MKFPWTLRPFVREIAADIELNPLWELNPFSPEILHLRGAHELCDFHAVIWLDWLMARVQEPAKVSLSTREWLTIRRAVRSRFHGGDSVNRIEKIRSNIRTVINKSAGEP